MLFKPEHIGKCIKKEVSDILRRYVGTSEYARAAELASEKYKKVSPSTVRDVLFRSNPLTENNSKAMNILAEIAFAKSNYMEEQAQYDHEYLAKHGVQLNKEEIESEDYQLETIK